MRYIKQFKPKPKAKTVQDYISTIDEDYNLMELSKEIMKSLDKYDIKYKLGDVLFQIRVYDERGKDTAHNTLLTVKYNLKDAPGRLDPIDIFNTDGSYLRGSDYKKLRNDFEVKYVFNSKAEMSIFKVILSLSLDEPEDLIYEALEFLDKKYGIKNTQLYKSSSGRKIATYRKEIIL